MDLHPPAQAILWSPREEPEPVEVSVGDLVARIAVRGRDRDQLKLHIAVTRRPDESPVAGVRLALEADQEPVSEIVTNAAGEAEFSLSQGRATLRLLSPVHAELTISL